MKHLLKKLSIAGAGGKGNKPKPPIYKPPVMGELQYGASHSYAETLDLLSDGPIEGIVNAHGELVDGLNILQGVYLDDTPVAVTSKSAKKTNSLTSLETETINSLNLELDSSGGVTYLSKFFEELNQTNDRSTAGRITALKSDTAGAVHVEEETSVPDANIMFVKTYNQGKPLDKANFLPKVKGQYALYIRGFIKYRGSSAQIFPWYLNGTLQANPVYDDDNAAYRNDAAEQSVAQGESTSLIWANSTDLPASKFLFGFKPFDTTKSNIARRGYDHAHWGKTHTIVDPTRLFAGTTNILNDNILPDLDSILNLYNENNTSLDTDNILQRDLAKRALENMGWRGDGVSELLPTHLKATSHGVVICKVTTEGNSNLQDKQILDGDALLEMQTLPYGDSYGFDLIAVMENNGITVTDVTCPEINLEGVLNGKMHGFLVFEFPVENKPSWNGINDTTFNSGGRSEPNGLNQTFKIPDDIVLALKDLSSFKYSKQSSVKAKRVNPPLIILKRFLLIIITVENYSGLSALVRLISNASKKAQTCC